MPAISTDLTKTSAKTSSACVAGPGTPSHSRVALLAAAAAATCVVDNSAEAVDFFNSGLITTNNTVGWTNGTSQLSSFDLTLKSGTAIVSRFFTDSTTATYAVYFGTNGQGKNFRVARLGNYIQTFDISATIGAAAALTSQATVGELIISSSNNRFAYGNGAFTGKYLLFRFQDNAEDYYGWVLGDSAQQWNGEDADLFLTVKAYAWQKASFGVIKAGATAVPEPSTLVTSGIAALAGGAASLRRWRRDRKCKPIVA